MVTLGTLGEIVHQPVKRKVLIERSRYEFPLKRVTTPTNTFSFEFCTYIYV